MGKYSHYELHQEEPGPFIFPSDIPYLLGRHTCSNRPQRHADHGGTGAGAAAAGHHDLPAGTMYLGAFDDRPGQRTRWLPGSGSTAL